MCLISVFTNAFGPENGLHCDDLHIVNGNITYTPPRMVSTEPLSAGHFQRYVGTIATYSCSSGYQLVGGSSLRACGPDRTWNGTESACGKPCSAIQVGRGGVHSKFKNSAFKFCSVF